MEEVEVAEEVVEDREELDVELGEREAAVGVELRGNEVLVPEHLL